MTSNAAKKMDIKTMILDFDGVIVESVDIKTHAFRQLFSIYTDDVEPIVAYHLRNNGVSRFIKFRHIWEKMLGKKYSGAIEERLGEEFSGIVADKVVDCPYVAGALDFLKAFHKKVPLYVASAVPEKELAAIAERKGIKDYFVKIYGYPPMTKPQAIDDIMDRESISAQEILYIGDSLEDLKAATGRGTLFIGRKNKESFKGYKVPLFGDMNGIANYILKNIEVRGERV